MAGLGGIGRLHARNAALMRAAELALLVDPDTSLAEATAAELGAPCSASFDDALLDPSVEAVVIATPTPLHADMTIAAAHAGKHVLCEKPLSLMANAGRAATHAARTAGVALQVGFQRRFDRDFVAARRMIEAGELGDVRLLRISHRNRAAPRGGDLTGRLGGPLVDMTIHDFDTARWLVGELAEVTAYGSPGATAIVGRFDSGALALIDNTRTAAYGFECSVEVMGERSTVRIGFSGANGDLQHLTPSGSRIARPADHIERHRDAYAEELRAFLACVRSGAAPAVGGDDATAALRLSLAAERCLA
ncbi:MAG TPA: Gfo/Idh/MocA family oxidoreductase [Thermoleophilaceae bacterium]